MSRMMKDSLSAYLLLSPIVIGLLIFCYYPPIRGLIMSVFEWNAAGDRWTFVGMDNFRRMAHDDVLIASVPNMLFLLVGGLIISVTVPLIMAELIYSISNPKWKYAYRVLILVPMVIPGVVGALVWQFVFDPNIGLINAILDGVGLGGWKHAWLGDSHTVLWAFLFMGFPWATGIGPLIYLSGLSGIPTEINESARLDGITWFRRVISIDIPLITGQIKFFLITGLIGGLQAFQNQYLLTNGGPGYSSMVPGYHMYLQAFTYNRLGYASAIGLVLFAAALILTIINMKFIKSKGEG
ncbi:carbohydrate ABC transporter permease [Paenibacillus nasutitermitis]|uniref:ABC transporter permease protein YurN n=1 Tax=Paenibacillus nasutitermitis TaxID=1652958 RepID=A0A916ZD15_9BACL|nr:sugar ABC transporter permease [Paenibacillus nasutitermitis]GGD88998.1 putative ABC transporter permease protein YurN [Paenibacillus nasutitermitis]